MQLGPMRFGTKIAIADHSMDNDPGFAQQAIANIKRDLAGEIAEKMGETQYNVRFMLHQYPKVDDVQISTTYVVDALVEPTRIDRIVVSSQREKHHCQYCHGYTTDDSVGNCAACGGPRNA